MTPQPWSSASSEPSVTARAGSLQVTVGIPTFRRPQQLELTLRAVLEQVQAVNSGGRGWEADVLIVDNDPQGSAGDVACAAESSLLRYVVESDPGISAARNRMLDESMHADVLVSIDDDEHPHEGWLDALLRRYLVDRPAAVYGRVVAEFDGHLDPWISAGGFFARFDAPDGAELDAAAAGNLLLDVKQLRTLGLRFESRLGLSGGEDNLLTRSIVKRGGRIVRSTDSIVTHRIPAERMTRRWVLERSWSHGNTHALVNVMLADNAVSKNRQRAAALTGGVARVAVGLGRWALGVVLRSRTHRARGLRTAFRGAGMVSGSVGYTFQEYARRAKRGWS